MRIFGKIRNCRNVKLSIYRGGIILKFIGTRNQLVENGFVLEMDFFNDEIWVFNIKQPFLKDGVDGQPITYSINVIVETKNVDIFSTLLKRGQYQGQIENINKTMNTQIHHEDFFKKIFSLIEQKIICFD